MLAKRSLTAIALGLGFLSTSTQVIILRELLVTFTGNELTLATTLAIWLLSVASGSFIFRRLAAKAGPALTGSLFIIAGTLAVFQAILGRVLDPLAGTIGEIVSPVMLVALSAACVTPIAVILGGLFVALVALAAQSREFRAVPVVYGFEAIGSAAAGAALSILLFRQANSFVCLSAGGLVGIVCGAPLLIGSRRRAGVGVTALSLAAMAGVIVFNSPLDLSTRRIQWSPLPVVRSVESRYGNLLVTQRNGTFDFYETGNLSYTIPDPRYAEESAHIPLLCHPAPERVLVIGGAGSGVVGEIVKHPTVRSVDFVELDPEIISLTREYAPPGWLEGPPGVAVCPVYGDGRKFMAGTDRAYDVVIVAVGVPVTLQTARYYTLEFFAQVDHVLDPGGLLAFKVPSGEAYVSPELGALLSTLRNTCGRVFEEVTLVPGDYIHFLASQSLSLGARTDSLAGVLRDRGIETSFVDEYHLFDRLAPLRRSELDSVTALYATRTVNSDFRPVSASYAVARWAKHFQSGRFLAALVERASPTSFVLGLLVSVSLIVPLLVRAAGSPRKALPGSLTLYALGLTSMFTQVLIIVGFQIVSGYVYGWIAVLIASFMLGMGLASGAAGTRGLVGKPAHLPFLMAGLGGLPLAALAAMRLADHLSSGGLAHLTDLVFVGLALVTGALGGTVFALGSTLLIRVGRGVVDGGALAYALDLCGATVAGFTTAFLAIPSFGIAGSAYAIAAFNAVLLVVILVWRPLRVLTGT